MIETNKKPTPIEDIELAHEAALAEDPLRSEARDILQNYNNQTFAEELLELSEIAFIDGYQTAPDIAAEKIKQAEEAGEQVFQQGTAHNAKH
jgi:hypothetical protein